MAVLNIEKSFLTENRSVIDFLNQSGQGLYIPLYQRDYSWDSDNIDQLLEDLSRGIQRIAGGEVGDDSKEIRFLGTIITVVEPNRDHIYPVEPQAIPSRIEKLIDGQQRVSTIALMATLLTKRLTEIKNKVKVTSPIYDQVKEICDDIWIDQKLLKVFSFDLGRGKPKLKPKIIRGAKDYWTREDETDIAYKSELANYLGHFIKAYDDKSSLPSLTRENNGNSLLYQNSRRIETWLKKVVSTAHEGSSEDEFATADTIIDSFSQEQIWAFERPDLVDLIKQKDYTDKKSSSYIISELVQVISVCHYLLDRCCFTIIQPTDDDWAFDMFQSLNATGTPLTAIETFKPTVVTTVDTNNAPFKDSKSDISFKKVEAFLSESTTAQQKNKRTNDFLTSFFVAYDGRTMSTHFSYQRKVLDGVYTSFDSFTSKEQFVERMGNYAEFYKSWNDYDGKNNSLFPRINYSYGGTLASLCILFLKSSNHKMAITILARMYENLLKGIENAAQDFTNTVKAVAGFYFLWRSSYSNSGLDSTYRDFFKQNKEISFPKIISHFQSELHKKNIDTKEQWILRAKDNCKYDLVKEIVRFALFVSAHDTIPDIDNPGLMKVGKDNSHPYLTLQKWLSEDLKTIEHIAPQTNDKAWDEELYDTFSKPYQSLGNLTLLPQDLNSSVGNKGWKEKLLYYQSVGEDDIEQLAAIGKVAKENGISLNPDTQKLLMETGFNEHILPICALKATDEWNLELVNRRTKRMLEIIWDRIAPWVFFSTE